MKEKNTILDATISVNSYLLKQHPESGGANLRYELAKRITAKARKAGVKICTGTDADQKFLVQEEMKLLVHECGFTPFDAIIAATKNGAEAIGILKSHGTVEPGKTADLLVLDKNPLDDIDNISSVNIVIKAGRLYKK
jgi:imidazolonepropionase-like amidohydrolase